MKKFLAFAGILALLSLNTGTALAAVTAINVGTQTGSLTTGTAGTSTYALSFTKTNGTSEISDLSVSGLPSGASYTLSATSSSASSNDPMPDITLSIGTTNVVPASSTTFTVNSGSPVLSATGTLFIGTGATIESCNGSTFDAFSNGSVNGQNGWHVSGPFDQAIVDNVFGLASFGCKSLRISNATTSPFIFNQTFSSSAANEAGEIDSLDSNGATGTPRNRFEAQFDLASFTQDEQPGIHMSVSPDRGDGTRMSALGFTDTATGIDVFFDDVTGTTSPVSFNEVQVASGLSRTVPHTVKFLLDFVEGASNDIVQIFIDGGLVHTGTSWENFYRFDNDAFPSPNPNLSRTVNSLVFYEQAPGTAANQSKGYLIDNVSLLATSTPVTGTTTPPASTSTPPVITLNGSPTMSVTINTVFTDPGATALDDLDGTVPVTATGTVNTAVVGGYTILYTATDSHNNVATTSRMVNVVAAVVPPQVTGGGGGGGSSGGAGYFIFSPLPGQNLSQTSSSPSSPPIVVGTLSTPTGQVLGVATFNFRRNLRFGSRGSDVVELQKFLISQGDLILEVPTQYFGRLTQRALARWQKKNNIPATGFFGPISRASLAK